MSKRYVGRLPFPAFMVLQLALFALGLAIPWAIRRATTAPIATPTPVATPTAEAPR